MAEPRIVEGTGAAVGTHAGGDTASADAQQQAMTEAVQKAHEEGITDPEEIKIRMLAARDAVVNG